LNREYVEHFGDANTGESADEMTADQRAGLGKRQFDGAVDQNLDY
jgi:hypothetical protein